ncbi:MAG: F0F1 ATP synthase subunit A [Candidatus Aureabacteria bacterium]|nr:F0F1 ATP synthase subunit A [Candidatus Auribacterota bacterium]
MQTVKEAVEIHIPGVPPSLLMSWIVWGILLTLSLAASRKISMVPNRLQNLVEFGFQQVFQLAEDVIGHEAKRFYPLFLGLFFYIFFANLLGLFPGLSSPTANINTPAALAVFVFIYYQTLGFKKHGIAYLKHFIVPGLPWWLTPVNILIFIIEVISHFVRPLSLSIRLFGNLFAKETLLGVLSSLLITFLGLHGGIKLLTLMPLVLRPVIILLGVLIGLVQALIFLILTMIYIGSAVKSEH